LYRIINDHADKHDITGIFIEETVLAESGHHTAVKDTERQPHKHGHNVFSESSAEAVPRYGIQEGKRGVTVHGDSAGVHVLNLR